MSTIAVNMHRAAPPRQLVMRSRLRITRRGRALLAALVTAPMVAAIVFVGLSGGLASAGSHPAATNFRHVTVEQGQSLWQIAQQLAPNTDPRQVISEIVDLNQLQSSVVSPGESLAIPAHF